MAVERTVFILGPTDLLWSALRRMLWSVQGLSLLGSSIDPTEVIEFVTSEPVGVLILDAGQARRVLQLLPSPSGQDDRESRIVVVATTFDLDELQACLALGVHAFLCWQDISRNSIERYLAGDGGVTLSPSAAKTLRLFAQRTSPSVIHPLPLAVRERALLSDLGRGLTQEQIATARHLSPLTVKRAIGTLEAKLGASSQFVLGARAAQRGLITPEGGPIGPSD